MTGTDHRHGPGGQEELLAFIPEIVRRELAHTTALPREPFEKKLQGVVLFADISGFTPLAEKLSRPGVGGAERIGEVLTRCFGQMIELIAGLGGEVFKFAGDATLAFWVIDPDESLEEEVLRAAQCGLDIQRSLDGMDVGQGVNLQLRVVIAAGPVRVLHVGGGDRWECVVVGPPLDQIEEAQAYASPGEVILSPEAAAVVADEIVAQRRDQGAFELEGLRHPAPAPARTPPSTASAFETLRAYVPRSVRARIDAGQAAWLSEFRRATVMFVSLRDLDYGEEAALQHLQDAFSAIQEAVYRYEGSINQFIVEDKGTTLIAAWGVSLHSHEDDPVRALLAARQVQKAFDALPLGVAIGITTGRAFTGIRGNQRRCEFALIGNVVNLSARLMAIAGDAIRCDAETQRAARKRFIFESFPPRMFKGMAEELTTFAPLSERSSGPRALIGRHPEREALRASLAEVEGSGTTIVHFIVGDPGIGKSRLVESLLEQTQASTVRGLLGAGESYERSTSYYPWRTVIRALFGLDENTPVEAAQQKILASLEADEELLDKAALLNDLVALDLPENETTQNMTSKARGEQTRELVVHLLNRAAQQAPILVVIEDAHWIDSASWALAEALATRVRPLLLVLTTRPTPRENMPESQQRILELDATVHTKISALNDDECLALACLRLDADSLPEEVAQLIRRKAEGHPFFTEQFVLALRDRGLIEVREGVCRVVENESELEAAEFPDDVQGIVTGRIDQLPPQQQLTLKVASVLGREFFLAMLRGVHPLDADRAGLGDQLSGMVHLDLLSETAAREAGYRFIHIITRDVAYELLPFAQRRELHHAVGEWLESRHSDDIPEDYPLLAYHWTEAGVIDKSLEYLEKAGEWSLSHYANREAVGFFNRALEVANAETPRGSDPAGAANIRRARWHRNLGDAHWKLGDTLNAIKHLKTGLGVLGRPIPESRLGLSFLALRQLLRQSLALARPGRSRKPGDGQREILQESSRAASLLAWIQIVRQDPLELMSASLLAANLGEQADHQSVLSLGVLGYSASAMRLRRLARRYFHMARKHGLRQADHAALTMASVFESLDLAGNGQFAAAQQVLDEALASARRIGDRHLAARASLTKATIHSLSGDFEKSRKHHAAALDALRGEASMDTAYIHMNDFLAAMMLESVTELPGLAEQYVPVIEASIAPGDLLPLSILHGLKALYLARTGALDQAIESADRAIACVGSSVSGYPPVAITPFLYPLEAYLAFWEQHRARGHPELKRIRKAAKHALNLLRRFARIYPANQARLHLYQGHVSLLEGRPDKARQQWRLALEAARRDTKPYDEGLALIELARLELPGSSEREASLDRAMGLFRSLGLQYERAAAEELRELA